MTNRRHRWITTVALVGGLALVGAACGNDDDASTDTTIASTETEAPADTTVDTAASDTGGAETTAVAETVAPDTVAAADSTVAGAAAETTAAGAATGELKKVKLQLQWVTQAQFAGYFAALDQGFWQAEGLDVEIVEGGVDIVPQTQLANGAVDFAIAWVPKALASRENGANITDIGQIFQRSGTLQVSWKDSNINGPADLKGKKVGNWGFGNEFELFAGMTQAGLDPAKDVQLVQQQFDMQALLKREIDAAQAMTYNEYAQVLEAKDPATNELFKPEQLNVINWNDVGTAMLQDAIWANTDKLENDTAYQDTAGKFVKGAMKGWIFCRDNADKCVDIVVAKGSKLGKSHQAWQMNEINKLVWPSPNGIGLVDQAQWDQTVKVAKETKNAEGSTVITKDPEGLAFTNDYATKALDALKAEGVDVAGTAFAPTTVVLTEGGS